MHAIASLLPHLSDGIQNYALCALLLSFHNVEKAILNSHSDFILYIFFIFWQMLLTIEFLAAPVHVNIITICRLCQSPIQYSVFVELADKLYNP